MEASKKYLYLFQGQIKNLKKYYYLKDRDQCDVIFLSYDIKSEGVIFYPNSTWAEGRNRLLIETQKYELYDYYIFCDDDIEFIQGGFELFEQSLTKYKPGIAVPVVPRSKNTVLKLFNHSYQSALFNDEQMMAFHREVIKDRLIMPYYLNFDDVHWWATCQIQEILLQNFYKYDLIQINRVKIENICNARYDISEDGENSFRVKVRDWISQELGGKFVDIREKNKKKNKLRYSLLILYRTLVYFIKRKIFRVSNSISKDKVLGKLSNSTLIRERLS